jgi:uncharacterized protein (DUF362 family)
MDDTRYRVAVVRADDTESALRRAFALLSEAGESRLSARVGGLVTIKPNLTAPRESGSGIVSDVAVVEALIRLIQESADNVERIVVADGPGMADAARCFEIAGYNRLRDDLGVELVDLNAASTRSVAVPDWLRYPALEIPEVVLDADLFISITPPKTHTDGLFTLSAKNMFGVPPNRFYGRPRKAFHRFGVSEVVHDICRARPIDLAILDGLATTQLGNPIDGERVALGVLAVGWNAQAVDVVGCGLMQVDPRRCDYLNYLRAAGYGPISEEQIDVLGERIVDVSLPFATPAPGSNEATSQLESAH